MGVCPEPDKRQHSFACDLQRIGRVIMTPSGCVMAGIKSAYPSKPFSFPRTGTHGSTQASGRPWWPLRLWREQLEKGTEWGFKRGVWGQTSDRGCRTEQWELKRQIRKGDSGSELLFFLLMLLLLFLCCFIFMFWCCCCSSSPSFSSSYCYKSLVKCIGWN